MKILVVYFSRSGHTGRIAKEIARRCEADLDAIRVVERAEGWWDRLVARLRSQRHAEPMIHRPDRNPARYDLVIIGSPLVRSAIAAPVRAYVHQYDGRFKRVAFFCAEGGSSAGHGFAELSKLCGQRPVATFAIDDARSKLPPAAHREGLTDFMDLMQRD